MVALLEVENKAIKRPGIVFEVICSWIDFKSPVITSNTRGRENLCVVYREGVNRNTGDGRSAGMMNLQVRG